MNENKIICRTRWNIKQRRTSNQPFDVVEAEIMKVNQYITDELKRLLLLLLLWIHPIVIVVVAVYDRNR